MNHEQIERRFTEVIDVLSTLSDSMGFNPETDKERQASYLLQLVIDDIRSLEAAINEKIRDRKSTRLNSSHRT